MREKYESLPLVQLKELAKVRGLKGTSTMKKAELVEAMLAEDERLKKEEEAKATEQKQESATETVRRTAKAGEIGTSCQTGEELQTGSQLSWGECGERRRAERSLHQRTYFQSQ